MSDVEGAYPMDEAVTDPPGYEILGELGRGGMGIVFKARDHRRDCLVAIKMILSGRGAEFRELARFRIEAEAIACLAHPNILRIHEVGVHLGYPFFALEFAQGGSLADTIRSRTMPCNWAAQITLKLALAMRHAHERNIIHWDIKLANVLMISDDTPKVTDFGLAKFTTGEGRLGDQVGPVFHSIRVAFQDLGGMRIDEYGLILAEWQQRMGRPDPADRPRLAEVGRFIREVHRQSTMGFPDESPSLARLTGSHAIIGTPQYMAPEQAWGRAGEVGPSADIYSLGAVMYEMLTGRPPFTGSAGQVVMEARIRPPVPPRQRRGSVAPALEAICMKCLEKEPGRRYESMGALAEDLRRFLDGSEVDALRCGTPFGQRLDPAPHSDDLAETRTWVPGGSTEPVPPRTRSWWQFWR